MKKNEFTKNELINLLNKNSIDGKISINSVTKIIFDSRFPDEFFEKAKEEIIEALNDEKRFNVLAELYCEKLKKALELQKKVVELSLDKTKNIISIKSLKKQIAIIEEEIVPVEKEFLEIRERISERIRV